MLDERNERRTHRRAMTAVLGSTAVIAIGGSMLAAPSANALDLGGALGAVTAPVAAALNQVTAPLGTTTTTTSSTSSPTPAPSASATTGPVGSLVSSVVAPVTSSVAGTTGTNLAPAATSVTAPITSSVDSLLAPITTGTTNTTTSTTTAPSSSSTPVTSVVSSVTTPVTTAVGGATGTDLAPTLSSVTTPVDSLLAPITSGSTTSGATTGTSVSVSPTTLVDLTGSGSGLVNTGSTGGLVGISAGSGVSVGLLNGSVTAAIGSGTTGTAANVSTGGTTATVSIGTNPTATAAPVPTSTAPPQAQTPVLSAADVSIATPAPTADAAITVSSAVGTPLASVLVGRSATTVYPVKDGYRDSVRFDVRGLSADMQAVGVIGTAVLKHAGTTVKSWTLNGATTSLTWDGRVGSAVRTGTYTLLVTAWSNDGTSHTASTTVQVLSQRLVSRTTTTRSKVTSTGSTAAMPKAVKQALALGPVSVRLKTVAKVHGKASLMVKSSTVKRTVALRSGTRTTTPLSVPRTSSTVTIKPVGKKGTRLVSVTAIWTYRALAR